MTRILVIEPDAATAASLSESLTARDRHVDVVTTALSAIRWTDEHGTPDCAVIDLELPDLRPSALVAALEARATKRVTRFYVSRDVSAGVRFLGAPVLTAPFEPLTARAVLAEAVIEEELRIARA